jgi:hypothetical protein
MRFSLLLGSLLVLSSLGRAAAQNVSSLPATVYTQVGTSSLAVAMPCTIERDSLWRRAARVRTLTSARIELFRKSAFAVGGTRHKVESYAVLQAKSGSGSVRYARIRREISKHKTTGTEIEKRFG